MRVDMDGVEDVIIAFFCRLWLGIVVQKIDSWKSRIARSWTRSITRSFADIDILSLAQDGRNIVFILISSPPCRALAPCYRA